MTIAPDVLDELDFPTPELTPTQLDAVSVAIEHIDAMLTALLPMLSGLLEAFTNESICWCSPSRAMLLTTEERHPV